MSGLETAFLWNSAGTGHVCRSHSSAMLSSFAAVERRPACPPFPPLPDLP